MNFNNVVELTVKYGLSTVLLFVLGYAYWKTLEKHAAERKEWEIEQRRLYASQHEVGEKMLERVMKMQEASIVIANQATNAAELFDQEKREMREKSMRELEQLRESMQRPPTPEAFKLPGRR